MIATSSREDGNNNRTHDEREPTDSIGADERPTSAKFVDVPNTESFANECNDGVAGLKSEGDRGIDTNRGKDLWGVILNKCQVRSKWDEGYMRSPTYLDHTDACHLDTIHENILR